MNLAVDGLGATGGVMAELCDGRRLSFGDIGRGLVQVFDLFHHAEHVPVLPHLNKLLIRDAGNGDTGNTDLSACGRDTQAGAVVCGRAGPAHADPVAFSEVVFDLNMSASEGSIDAIVELIEGPGPDVVVLPSCTRTLGAKSWPIASRCPLFQTSSKQRRPRSRSASFMVVPPSANHTPISDDLAQDRSGNYPQLVQLAEVHASTMVLAILAMRSWPSLSGVQLVSALSWVKAEIRMMPCLM
jgi:hypothetical protein